MIDDILSTDFAWRLGWSLLHSVWQFALIGGLVGLLLAMLSRKSANLRYWVACLGLASMYVPLVATFTLAPQQPLDVRLNVGGATTSEQLPMTASSINAEVTMPGPVDIIDESPHVKSAVDIPVVRNEPVKTDQEKTAEWSGVLIPAVSQWLPWIVGVWMLGVGVLVTWNVGGWIVVQRLRTRATIPAAKSTLERLEELGRRMRVRVPVRLVESLAVDVPMAIGWLRPVILLPASLLTGLPQQQLDAILAHELAHIRRFDYLFNLLQSLTESLLFYHPAVWLLSRRIRIEREFCCDDAAIEVCDDKTGYVNALATVENKRVVQVHALSLAGHESGTTLSRIRRIMGISGGTPHAWTAGGCAVLLTTVISLGVAFSQNDGASSKADEDDVEAAITPIEKVAEGLAAIEPLKRWKLVSVDEKPTVSVDGYDGFRIVLRRTWKHYTRPPQQRPATKSELGPFELRHEDWEFVCVPVRPKKAPPTLKSRIKWEKSDSPYYTRDICLGEGEGYLWFTHGTLFLQDAVRKQLKLSGGDDRIQLLVDGLSVEDLGSNTSNSCGPMLAQFGDRALPYIERAIERAGGDDPLRVVRSLGYIRTQKSTALLMKLAESEEQKLRLAAYYALVQVPLRESARPTYLEMLRRHRRVQRVCQACIEFQWREALPVLRDLIEKPRNFREFETAIRTRRVLEGNPIPKELFEAEKTLRSLVRRDVDPESRQRIENARDLLITSDDTEAANLAALSLALFVTKGDTAPVRSAGIEILRSRPEESTMKFLTTLAANIAEHERGLIEGVIETVAEGRSAQNRQEEPRPEQRPQVGFGFPKNAKSSALKVEVAPSWQATRSGKSVLLAVKITNKSSKQITTTLAHEWHGGIWPPTHLYASVTPAGNTKTRPFHPVYLAAETRRGLGEIENPTGLTTIEAGKSQHVELRMNWPGTGAMSAWPLIAAAGTYQVQLLLVFKAAGRQQYVTSDKSLVKLAVAVVGSQAQRRQVENTLERVRGVLPKGWRVRSGANVLTIQRDAPVRVQRSYAGIPARPGNPDEVIPLETYRIALDLRRVVTRQERANRRRALQATIDQLRVAMKPFRDPPGVKPSSLGYTPQDDQQRAQFAQYHELLEAMRALPDYFDGQVSLDIDDILWFGHGYVVDQAAREECAATLDNVKRLFTRYAKKASTKTVDDEDLLGPGRTIQSALNGELQKENETRLNSHN